MMGGGMIGMMGGRSESPRMMQMRGEMMKAMGEVLMKYSGLRVNRPIGDEVVEPVRSES